MHSKRRGAGGAASSAHGNLTVFVGRFMPGARSIVFGMAGMSKMSYFRFLLIDGMAAVDFGADVHLAGPSFREEHRRGFFSIHRPGKEVRDGDHGVHPGDGGDPIYIVRRRRPITPT